MGGISVLVLIY